MLKEQQVAEVKVVKGTAAFNEAYLQEPPPIRDSRTFRLFGVLLLGCFCQTMNGFDGSLFNGLTANHYFLNHFHGANNGIWAGIVSSMYQIGGVVALPFVGPCIDTWGRRVGMIIGAVLIVCGTVITGTTLHNASVGQFEGGRFLLGFGVSIVSSAGPIYVVETSHPAFRSILTAYCVSKLPFSHESKLMRALELLLVHRIHPRRWRCPWWTRSDRKRYMANPSLATVLLPRYDTAPSLMLFEIITNLPQVSSFSLSS